VVAKQWLACLDQPESAFTALRRERYDEPVMAIRYSRVLAQTGD
jgi:hypothetical protein